MTLRTCVSPGRHFLFSSQVLYTDKNFVACAPTGSGKTVLFELAIIHLLMETSEPWRDVKAVYSEHTVLLSRPLNVNLPVSKLALP